MQDTRKLSWFGRISNVARVAFTILLVAVAGVSVPPARAADAVPEKPAPVQTPYPQIVNTIPQIGATGVDPGLKEIRVTFDRAMTDGMSWTGGPPLFPPLDEGRKAKWIDKRTCILPVSLEEGRFYRLGINSTSHQYFRSAEGVPAPSSAFYFATRGADESTKARVRAPEIVKIDPANGSGDVDPAIKALRVTFNMRMGRGMSWTGSGASFPKAREELKATWSEDQFTCTLPVTLEPGRDYELGLNSLRHINFQSEWGVPLPPVVYKFHTRDAN